MAMKEPMTLKEFVTYAAGTGVNPDDPAEGVGRIIAAAIREELRQTDGLGDPGAWGKVECGDCGCYVNPRREHRCR